MEHTYPIASKITDCISEYISLNNRPLDIVNDTGLVRVLAGNPRYRLMSWTYQTDTNLVKRVDQARSSIGGILGRQPGAWFTTDLWSTANGNEDLCACP